MDLNSAVSEAAWRGTPKVTAPICGARQISGGTDAALAEMKMLKHLYKRPDQAAFMQMILGRT